MCEVGHGRGKGDQVSWQDDLRKLDDELAAGRMSADEYRVRRDRVLSSAVSPGSQQEPEVNEKTQFVQVPPPGPTPAPGPGPAAPPPAPGQQPAGQGGDADKTQVVPGQTAEGDRTQAVGGWQTARPGGDADRTQVVPGVPTQSMAGGQPPRPAPPQSPPAGFPQPGWQQQPYDELAPPWAGSEFPPLAATGTPAWIKQGPEVFDEDRSSGKAGRIVAIIASVVVLAGIAFGAFWIWGRGNDDNNAGGPGTSTTKQTPTTTTSKPPPDPLPTGKFPGKVTENKTVRTFADIPRQSYLTQPELQAYQPDKAGKTKLVLSDVGSGNRLVVMLVMMPDAASAQASVTALNQIQIGNGMVQNAGGAPPKVLLVQREPAGDQKGRIRAHYVSGNIIVRLDLTTSAGDTSVSFNDILTSQLEVMPADG